jgi:hypothetical protein
MPDSYTGRRSIPEPRGDVSKLPKWAQHHIELLTRDLTESLERESSGPVSVEDALVVFEPYGAGRSLTGNPRKTDVQFNIGRRYTESIIVSIEIDSDNDPTPMGLRITSQGAPIKIVPKMTNTFVIEMETR